MSSYSNKRHKGTPPTLANKQGKRKSIRGRSNLNMLATRASVKTKGSKKVKGIVHRKKSVHVSKPLRKKIQKVIDGNAYKGTYHTTRFGTIGITTTGNSGIGNIEDITVKMGGYPAEFAFSKQNKDCNSYNRWWFGQPLQFAGATSTASLTVGSEWQFFSPLKIVDAASVLWNSKTIKADYSDQTRNMNTVHQEANGAPVVGTNLSPQLKGLKIHVDNSYVKFIMKNSSQRSMKVCVYNCVPSIKFPAQLPLGTFQTALVTETDGANSAYMDATNPGFTGINDAEGLFYNPQFEPNMMKSFRSTWKYEKKTIRLGPGESVTHSVQGPRGYILDYNKLYNAGGDNQGQAYKGTTMCVMMSVEPDLVYVTSGVVGDTQGVTGHFTAAVSAANTVANPISIQWDEVYRLSIPEIAGFTQQTGVIGDPQNLNLRLPRRAFGNFCVTTTGTADPDHTDYDKENPAVPIEDGLPN